MLDADLDCSRTLDGWFEVKSYIAKGPGWEPDIAQPGAPWACGNHFARCGWLNVFARGQAEPIEQRELAHWEGPGGRLHHPALLPSA